MDPATIAALISGVSSMVGTGAAIGGTTATNKKSIEYAEKENILQRQFAEHQAAVAYQRQLEMWNKENAYNTPSAQMARYVEAGLNPNLIYNNGQVPSPVPAVAPVGNTTSHVPMLSNPLSPENLSFARLTEAQIKNIEADTEKKEADTQLSYKQGWQIGELVPAMVNQINSEAATLKQMFDSNEFKTAVEQFKLSLFNDEGKVVNSYSSTEWDPETGQGCVVSIARNFKQLVKDEFVKSLYASEKEYEIAIESFLDQVGIISETKYNLELTNQDLQEFVNVCAKIYQAQEKEAELASLLAEGNQDFWSVFDGQSELLKMVGGFLKIVAQGFMSRYAAGGRPASGGIKIYNNMPKQKKGK